MNWREEKRVGKTKIWTFRGKKSRSVQRGERKESASGQNGGKADWYLNLTTVWKGKSVKSIHQR